MGGTPDYSTIYFQTEGLPFGFLPGVTEPAVYEWSQAGGLQLIAEGAESGALSPGIREPRMVSEDGSTVFFQNLSRELFVRRKGEPAINISGPGTVRIPEYVGASADGSVLFYADGGTVYRYDTKAQVSTVIAENVAQAGAEFGVSADGQYVYYVTNSQELLVWHDGETHLILRDFIETPVKRTSENGRYLMFGSLAKITEYNNEGVMELYRYDAVTGELACASCRTDGGRPLGDALPGDTPSEKSFFEFYNSRSVSNNGEVFFDTPDPLVPADVNSSRDVYSFDGRQQVLISSGTGKSDSFFGDATPDGKNVYFTTYSQLVKADKDEDIDLYDARIGGGIPAQESEAEAPGCSGAGCRASVGAASVVPAAIGSEALTGGPAGRGHRACPKGKRLTKKAGRPQCVKRAGKQKQGSKKKHRGKKHGAKKSRAKKNKGSVR
jgi:hypothetical protein